jgi:hypothetical protein
MIGTSVGGAQDPQEVRERIWNAARADRWDLLKAVDGGT